MNHTSKRTVLAFKAALLCAALPASALAEEVVDEQSTSSSASDERSTPRFAVTLQPLALVSRSVLVDAGVELGSNFSLMLDAHRSRVDTDDARGSLDGFGFGIQYAFGDAMEGLYLYPRMGIDTADLIVNDERVDASVISLGGTGGYQWWWQPITLRVGAGASYAWVQGLTREDQREASGAGLVPRIDLNLGVAF